MLSFLYKAFRRTGRRISGAFSHILTSLKFKGNSVEYKSFTTTGVPYVDVWRGGRFVAGDGLSLNNSTYGNPLGGSSRCVFVVSDKATLTLGRGVGISQAVIIAHDDITIGDNVKIGAGTKILSTDFHSLDSETRRTDSEQPACKPVCIGDDAFIGTGVTILKGVKIGRRCIIGASAVVTRDVPEGEIWAGNPARKIGIAK